MTLQDLVEDFEPDVRTGLREICAALDAKHGAGAQLPDTTLHTMAAASSAISLKRIADVLERREQA